MDDTKAASFSAPGTKALHADLQQRILDLLSNAHTAVLTRQEMAGMLNKPINCVTAPVKHLIDAGLIVEHEQVWNGQTGRLNWALKLKG